MDIRDMRRNYEAGPLDEADVAATPVEQFSRWFDEVNGAGVVDANAMALSTVGADGRPSSRIVLVKQADEQGLVFFTNGASRKGEEMAGNPYACLLFHWREFDRQVRIEGRVEPIGAAESDEYWAMRPHESQVSGWASPQSRPVADRAELERMEAEAAARFPGDVPRPEQWGGFRLVPEAWEFWQGRPSRLHDRLRFELADDQWHLERLAP